MIGLGTSLAAVIKKAWFSLNCRHSIIELSFEGFRIRKVSVRLVKILLQ